MKMKARAYSHSGSHLPAASGFLLSAARQPLDDQSLIASIQERLGFTRLSPRTLRRDCELLTACREIEVKEDGEPAPRRLQPHRIVIERIRTVTPLHTTFVPRDIRLDDLLG